MGKTQLERNIEHHVLDHWSYVSSSKCENHNRSVDVRTECSLVQNIVDNSNKLLQPCSQQMMNWFQFICEPNS